MPFLAGQEISPVVQNQFTEEDWRLLVDQLDELKTCRKTVLLFQANNTRDAELDAREREIHKKELEQEKDKTALALEKMQFYKDAYEAVTQGRSTGCWIKKIFSLGIARCR